MMQDDDQLLGLIVITHGTGPILLCSARIHSQLTGRASKKAFEEVSKKERKRFRACCFSFND